MSKPNSEVKDAWILFQMSEQSESPQLPYDMVVSKMSQGYRELLGVGDEIEGKKAGVFMWRDPNSDHQERQNIFDQLNVPENEYFVLKVVGALMRKDGVLFGAVNHVTIFAEQPYPSFAFVENKEIFPPTLSAVSRSLYHTFCRTHHPLFPSKKIKFFRP